MSSRKRSGPEDLKVKIYHHDITIPTPSELTRRRWMGELSPEPETVAWIEAFRPFSVLFDVGANCGTHSIRAALLGHTVFSFEPEARAFGELCAAVLHNRIANVRPYPYAVSNRGGTGVLQRGRSDNTFEHVPKQMTTGSSITAVTLDDMLKQLGQPDYIKIDVDGNELDILRGGLSAISRSREVLIEIDPGIPDHREIVPLMRSLGFSFDTAQVEACRERGGKYDGMANHIFRITR